MGNCVRKESSSSDISAQFNKAPIGYPHHHAMPGPSHQQQFAMQGGQPFPRPHGNSMASMGSNHHITQEAFRYGPTPQMSSANINNASMMNGQGGTPQSARRAMPLQHYPSVTSNGSGAVSVQIGGRGTPGTKKPSLPHAQSTSSQANDEQTILIALYPYESRAEGDLSFAKGDAMILLDASNADWWYVRHMTSNERGYVPRNFVAPTQSAESEEWYAGKIARNQAERLVEQSNLPPGTFLVREREGDNDQFALTIRDEDKSGRPTVKHYKIKRLDDGGFYITTRRTFRTLRSLVDYYSEVADGLCCKLVFPAPRIAPVRPDLSHNTAKCWEIPRDELQLERQLGTGNFGEVWYGKWRGVVEVAIKSMKEHAMSKKAFLDEAEIMKKCYHPNLVRLFAVCTTSEPFYIITEYMCNGSLLSYLRGPEGSSMPQNALIEFCAMIANGMAYLEERKMVHRDLAARNVLVGQKISGVPQVKVADFGLARILMDEEIYEATTGAKFPIKWTAPEAALNGNFTVKSDVWSYGILLYEIITRGQTPYPGMANREVIEQVQIGYRMSQPLDCPLQVYEIMLSCWDKVPDRRPTFEWLYSFFNDFYVNVQPNYQAQSES